MTESQELASAASRLCSACGMCCNGVLFHRVRLQPKDSAKTLAALGLKLEWKKKKHSILQPCPAHQGCQCSIYTDRPERCRLFECRLLLNLGSGVISEAQAAVTIQEAQRLVFQVRELLKREGSKNEKKSFVVRFESILSQPLFERSDPASMRLRRELIDAYAELEKMLAEHFRVPGRTGEI